MRADIKEHIDIMLKNDHFSKWLGIEVMELDKGYSKCEMSIKKDMLNGFGMVHGGVIFSLADSAFAFASNGEGRISVALEVSISFTKAVNLNDILIAEAKEINSTYRTGLYMVEVRNQLNEIISIFKGTVFRTSKNLK